MIFAVAALPMLARAVRTKDLGSYSRGHLVMSNVGNIVYSAYVFHLPPGPVWMLHSFYLLSSALMLGWSLCYASSGSPRRPVDVALHHTATGVSHAEQPAR